MATNNINDLSLLVHIVEAGSLSKAALIIDSSPPAVSRRLAAMEKRLGVRLIDRHARRFQLTEAGTVMYERAHRILADIEDAEAEAMRHSQALTGRLRLGAMLQLGRHRLAPQVARFSQEHPEIQIELILSDDPLDLVEDDLDILFQFDLPQQLDVIARKITTSRLVMCASPDYLHRRSRPVKPDDLLSHDCLCLLRGPHVLRHWKVLEDGVPREIEVKPALVTNSAEALYRWIVDGYGVGLQIEWDIEEDLATGRLLECLNEYSQWPLDFYAIFAYRRYPLSKISAFLDFMKKQTAGRLETSLLPPSAASSDKK